GPGAVHIAVVADIGDSGVLLRFDVHERTQDRGEGRVHPYLHRAEFRFDAFDRAVHGLGVGDIHRHRQGSCAGLLDFSGRRVPPPRSPPNSRSHHAVARGPPTVVVRVAADLCGPITALRHSWVTATRAIWGSYVHQGKRPMVFGTVGNGQ